MVSQRKQVVRTLLLFCYLTVVWGSGWLPPVNKGEPDDHKAYCFCLNCPGEPWCCCGKATTPWERLRLSASCDRPLSASLWGQESDRFLCVFPSAQVLLGSNPPEQLASFVHPIPSAMLPRLEKPPRLL